MKRILLSIIALGAALTLSAQAFKCADPEATPEAQKLLERLVKIRDKGCGIADVAQAMQPLFTTAPEEERAGLGFAVMQSFCDKVRVRSAVGKGTTVTLEKQIGGDD